MQDAKVQPPATKAVPHAVPAAQHAGTDPQATPTLAFVIPDTVQLVGAAPVCENGVCHIPAVPAKRD